MEQEEEKILYAADLLKRGELVAFPTETVYGLGAPVFFESAVKKIFLVKGRPANNPLIAHVSCISQVDCLALDLPKNFFLLAKAFWPGPLTMVLKRRPDVPSLVSAGHSTIAVRMPAHDVALRLIEAVGEPLVAPSANLSGRPSPTRASHVREDLGDKVALILDGGECSIGIESTVIYLAGTSPVLLRPGSIRKEELESVLQTEVLLTDHTGPVYSPGMLHRHYSPKAQVRLFLDSKDLPMTHSYLLSSEERPSSIVFNRRNFYALLREADQQGIEEVAIYCDPLMQQDLGLMNRVFRCAGFLS